MDGAEERLEVGDLNGNMARTVPIRIGQDAGQQQNAIHLRANALLDACDAPGQGMYASPTDPHQFFLHDEDDDAPVMTIEQGRGLILGGSGRDGASGGHAGNAGHARPGVDASHPSYEQPSVSREFSRGSHGSMGSFPPIPEDFVPVNNDDDFSSEQFAMAEVGMMANGPAGVPQLTDDFGVRYGVAGDDDHGSLRMASGLNARGMGARVASMPNFRSYGLGTDGVPEDMMPSPSDVDRLPVPDVSSDGFSGMVSKGAVGSGLRRTAVPKSYSTTDLSSLASKYDVPHAQFLTAPSMRKGKGGRQPKMDPRMDPNIDPKKAKRILANRLSAAKSKLKQKTAMENLKVRIQGLEQNKIELEHEIMQLLSAYQAELAMNGKLWELKREAGPE